MRSRMSWEVAVEAKEKVLPESLAVSSSSAALFSGMAAVLAEEEELGGVSVLERWRAEALHDLERNSMGPLGLSGSGGSPFGPFSAQSTSIFVPLLYISMLLILSR